MTTPTSVITRPDTGRELRMKRAYMLIKHAGPAGMSVAQIRDDFIRRHYIRGDEAFTGHVSIAVADAREWVKDEVIVTDHKLKVYRISKDLADAELYRMRRNRVAQRSIERQRHETSAEIAQYGVANNLDPVNVQAVQALQQLVYANLEALATHGLGSITSRRQARLHEPASRQPARSGS